MTKRIILSLPSRHSSKITSQGALHQVHHLVQRLFYAAFAASLFGILTPMPLAAQNGAQTAGQSTGKTTGKTTPKTVGQAAAQIVTIDRQRLFSETQYGRRIRETSEEERVRLATETRKAEELLLQEERQLTQQKATLAPDAFRELAKAFDAKVQALRDEGSAREQMFVRLFDNEQAAFFEQIGPILGQLVREMGAVMIIDRRAVLLAAKNIDITDEAIARIDTVLGDGKPMIDDAVAPTQAQPRPPVDPEQN